MTTELAQRLTPQQDGPASPGEPRALALARAMGRLASWRVWVPSAALFGLFAGVFFGSSAPFAIPTVQTACGQAPPDVRFTTSAAEVGGFLDGCGALGREAYRSLQMADLFYPLVFALFMASSTALVISRLVTGRRAFLALAALPLLASAFDYVENVCAWLALGAFPGAVVTNTVLGLASAAKTITSCVAGVVLLGALAALVVSRVRRRVGPWPHTVPSPHSSQAR